MVNEAMAVQRADVGTIKKKRGGAFVINDANAYLNAVKKMVAHEEQSDAVIALHVNSVKAHFSSLKALTRTVRPEDDPFVEHYQTPVVLEVLYDEDEKFRRSVDVFIEAVGASETLIGLESVRRYGGFYGPTCVVDFALIPGSTSNVINQILKKTEIPDIHKQTLLAAKSWGMNTSYGIGEVFATAIENGASLIDATRWETEMIQSMYDEPTRTQAQLMGAMGQMSFDVRKYMVEYRKKMESTVRAAIDDGVHYANIVTIPAYCVGDVGHHISQSTFNMCKDDVVMAVIEAVTGVMESTLSNGVSRFENAREVVSLATGASAAATEYILELDGFNAIMLTDLFTTRFHNYVQLYPTRSAAAELHNCDFLDMIYRGWKILDRARRVRNGRFISLRPETGGHFIDLSPIHHNEVLMNPQRYAYPASAITVRASALFRLADNPCLLTSEPVTATLMTNIIALDKDIPAAPSRICKDCASASCIDFRHEYCQYREAV